MRSSRPRCVEAARQLLEPRRAVGHTGARRRQHQHALGLFVDENRAEQHEQSGTGAVHVVEHEYDGRPLRQAHRSTKRPRPASARRAVSSSASRAGGRSGRRRRSAGTISARSPGQRPRHSRARRRSRLRRRLAPVRLRSSAVPGRSASAPSTAKHDRVVVRAPGRSPGEARLADAGLALDEDHAASAPGDLAETIEDLSSPPDDDRRTASEHGSPQRQRRDDARAAREQCRVLIRRCACGGPECRCSDRRRGRPRRHCPQVVVRRRVRRPGARRGTAQACGACAGAHATGRR